LFLLLSSSAPYIKLKTLAVFLPLTPTRVSTNFTDEIRKNYLRVERFSHLSLSASAGPGQHHGTAAQMTIKTLSETQKHIIPPSSSIKSRFLLHPPFHI
jgi:hypothetical protein